MKYLIASTTNGISKFLTDKARWEGKGKRPLWSDDLDVAFMSDNRKFMEDMKLRLGGLNARVVDLDKAKFLLEVNDA